MSYSTTHTTRTAILTAFSATIALSVGCGPTRTAELSQSEQQLVLEEIGLEESMFGYDNTQIAQGPSLIAGDWLAIQCAHAGGYFDNFDWAPVYAPVYANVVATDFE